MKEFVLPIILVVFLLSDAATIERNDKENEVIPRGIKEKENDDTTQKSAKPTIADKTDKIINGRHYKLVDDGSSGRVIPFKTTHFEIVDNGSLGRIIIFNTTGPLYSSNVLDNHYSETNKAQSEEFRSAAKESDKKLEFPGKSSDKLESNEKHPERFESNASYHKDFELRTNPNGLKQEDKYILLQREGDKHAEESDSNAAGSEILLNLHFEPSKFPGVLNSNEKQLIKDETYGNNLKAIGILKKEPEIINSKQNRPAESILKLEYPPKIVRHVNPTYSYITEKKEKHPERHEKHFKVIPIIDPQESNIFKWGEKLSDVFGTLVKPLKNTPSDLKYFENFDRGEKYQNLIKSKKPLLEELESVKIHPENVKPSIKHLFRIIGEYPKDTNLVHGNKHPFEFGPQRRFSEKDESWDKYFGASKPQERKQEGKKMKHIFLRKFNPQEIHSLALDPQEKLPDEIESTGKHPESESKGNHVGVEKQVFENKTQDLNFNKTQERDEPLTIQHAAGLEVQEKHSRGFEPQEKYSSVVELHEKYPDRFHSTAKYPTFRMKGRPVNVSTAIRETSSKKGQILNLNGIKGRNAIGENEVVILIPLEIKDPHKHDNDSSNQENALGVEKDIDIEVEIHLMLSLPSEKNKTYESKDKVPNETYEYENDKNSSEGNFTLFDKTENREKVNESETSRNNENITVNNGSGYNTPIGIPNERRQRAYFHKSIRAAEPLWLLDLEKSSETFRKRDLDSHEGISSGENKSINSKKFNLRTKKSVLKHKPNSGTANETKKETKREDNYEITTENRPTSEADNQQTNNVTTEETVKETVALNAEAENKSLMHSGIIKQKGDEINNSEASKIGELKYRNNQPSEKIEILTGDNKKHNFELKYNSNDSTLKQVKVLNNTKKGMEIKDQNENSTKPIQEVSEGNTNETKKDSRTTSDARDGLLSKNVNKSDTSKLEKEAEKTILYRQPNIMTTEVTIQENVTINNNIASTLKISNNTENIPLNDKNNGTKKSENKNSTVFREDNKKNGSTPLIDKNNTDEKGTADQTTSNSSGVRRKKSKAAAADTVTETTTETIHEGAIKAEFTRSIDENSTAKIESFVWTGMDGLYNDTSMQYRSADEVNEGIRSKHENITVQEPTIYGDRNSDKSTDEQVKNETKKQTLKKGDESELAEPTKSESQNDESQRGHSGLAEEKMDASHVNKSSKSTSEASNFPKGIKYRHNNKEMKNEQEKVTGNNSKETAVIDGEPKSKKD